MTRPTTASVMPPVMVARAPKDSVTRLENGENRTIGTVSGRISRPASIAE